MTRRLRPCAQPGCPTLTHTTHCPQHTRSWNHPETASARGYGAQWRKLRTRTLRLEPHCRTCGAPASTVDHITPKHLGGTDSQNNLQSLCQKCHVAKSAHEGRAARG